MNKITKYIVIIIFSSMMLTSTIVVFAESVNILKSQMTDDEKGVCGTFVITDLWSIPVRVEMEYKELPNVNSLVVKTQSDLKFERGNERFIMVTETIDRHDLTLMLDYKTPTTQEVYYRVYSNSDPVQEGTWLQNNSPVFCMKFHFLAQEPPPVYDAKYFEEKFLEVEGKKLGEIIENQEESEAFNTVMGILGMMAIMVTGIMVIIIIIKFNDVKKALATPTNALLKAVKAQTDSESDIHQATEHFVVKSNEVISRIKDEAHKLEISAEKTLKIASTVKPTIVEDIAKPEPVQEIKKKYIPILPENALNAVKKGMFVIKDQFVGSDKKEQDLEKLSVQDRSEVIRENYKRKTRDELCKITNEIYPKLVDKTATVTDRLSYDIAQELIQKK